jgi:hypothetical protein
LDLDKGGFEMNTRAPRLFIWFLFLAVLYIPFHYFIAKFTGDMILIIYTVLLLAIKKKEFFGKNQDSDKIFLNHTGPMVSMIFIETLALFSTALLLESKLLGFIYLLWGALAGFTVIELILMHPKNWGMGAWGDNLANYTITERMRVAGFDVPDDPEDKNDKEDPKK